MHFLRNNDGNTAWLTEQNRQLIANRNEHVKYSNKRCNCKLTTKALHHQQQLQQQEEKQQTKQAQPKYTLASKMASDGMLFCCRKQQRAARAAAATEAAAGTTKLVGISDNSCCIEAAALCMKTHCHCSKGEVNSKPHAAFVPNTTFEPMKFQLHLCDSSNTQTALQTQTKPLLRSSQSMLAATVAKLQKNSMHCKHSSKIDSNSCRQQHAALSGANSQRHTVDERVQQNATSAASPKQNKVQLYLLLFLLQSIACLLTRFPAQLSQHSRHSMHQSTQHFQILRRRKYCSFLLCSILCGQLLALAPATHAQRGSSSTAMGLEFALGTTATALSERMEGVSYAADVQQHLLTAFEDTAELTAALQKHKKLNRKLSNNSSVNDALLGGRSLVQLISRDHVLDRAHETVAAAAPATAASPVPAQRSCQSCQMREKAKMDNLESIKEHILMRLKLSKLPNITAPIQVPRKIIDNFYKIASKRKFKSAQFDAPSLETTADFMQSDDPKAYSWQDYAYNAEHEDEDQPPQHTDIVSDEEMEEEQQYEEDEDDFEEQFYSRVNSVYVFPTTPRIRHNRKHEILNFKLDQNHSIITHTIVHIYIRGRDWMREYEPALLEYQLPDGKIEKRREIVITVHRAVRRQNATNITHTVKLSETRHKISSGLGQWVQIDVKQLPSLWTSSRNVTQGIVIKGLEPWMRSFIVTGSNGESLQNKAYTTFIELLTQDEQKKRRKRSTSLDCAESDNEVRCCRYPLRVNFTNFGWNWVVAPTSFNAYFCNGECKLGFLEKHAHTHLASLSTSAQPCCSPTKMSPLKLLYFNSDQILVLSTIPNMSVEKCSCS